MSALFKLAPPAGKDFDTRGFHTPGIKGFYFNEVVTKVTVAADAATDPADEEKTVRDLMAISHAKSLASKFTVFGLGQPLFQSTSLLTQDGAPDVWVRQG